MLIAFAIFLNPILYLLLNTRKILVILIKNNKRKFSILPCCVAKQLINSIAEKFYSMLNFTLGDKCGFIITLDLNVGLAHTSKSFTCYSIFIMRG